jgi:hypothetical protein
MPFRGQHFGSNASLCRSEVLLSLHNPRQTDLDLTPALQALSAYRRRPSVMYFLHRLSSIILSLVLFRMHVCILSSLHGGPVKDLSSLQAFCGTWNFLQFHSGNLLLAGSLSWFVRHDWLYPCNASNSRFPPFAATCAPLIQRPSSLARNPTTNAMSSGKPIRFSVV